MGCLGALLVPPGFLMMLSAVLFPSNQDPHPIASLGCLVLIAGLMLIVLGRVLGARRRRVAEETNRRRMGAGWRPCPICRGSGQVVVRYVPPSPNGGGGYNVMGRCGTCYGHGWFSPSLPGTPPPL